MAIIGQALTAPEAGWRRYDNLDPRILYSGGAWADIGSASYYGGSSKQLQAASAKFQFKFYGTKFRWLFLTASACSAAVNVKVDGQKVGVANLYSAATVFQALNFEVTGLPLGEHLVEIENTTATYIGLDSIDIDDIGKLIHPLLTEKTSIFGMQVGDVISCDYVAGAGVVGTFSNLGNAQASALPKVPTAAANGSFYFVMVGRDTQGRLKLVADRELQLITWKALNTAGLVYGKDVQLDASTKSILRLPTGGLSASDVNNEWGAIIKNSTLNGKITAGNDAVWNYVGSTSYVDATSTTHSSGVGNRVARGSALDYYTGVAATSNFGYRPVMIAELLNKPPVLTVEADCEATYSQAVRITGAITDGDGDTIAYRVIVNNDLAGPWSQATHGPVAVDVTIPASSLALGANTITVEATDGKSSSFEQLTVIRKSIDSTYVAAGVSYKGSKSLKAGAGNVAYVDVDSPKATSGYIIGGSLTLNILAGAGDIVVAPVLAAWSSATLDANNPPAVASGAAITLSVSSAGVATFDISDLAKTLRDNFMTDGIAIYGVSAITFDVLGLAVDYTYQPTELYLPEKVYGNKVLLKWKPYILERPESVDRVKLMRSASADMSGAVAAFETTDISVLQYEDTGISEGRLYYRIEINYVDLPDSSTKLDFDEADEAGFIQQDAVNGTDFNGGSVTLKRTAASTVVEDFSDTVGISFDTAKLEVVSGRIQFKEQ